MALFVTTVLAIVPLAFSVSMRNQIRNQADSGAHLVAEMACQSGLEFALAQLAVDGEWAGTGEEWQSLGGGACFRVFRLDSVVRDASLSAGDPLNLQVEGKDEQALHRLNAEVDLMPGDLLADKVLATLGGSAGIVESVVDGDVLIMDGVGWSMDYRQPETVGDGWREGTFLERYAYKYRVERVGGNFRAEVKIADELTADFFTMKVDFDRNGNQTFEYDGNPQLFKMLREYRFERPTGTWAPYGGEITSKVIGDSFKKSSMGGNVYSYAGLDYVPDPAVEEEVLDEAVKMPAWSLESYLEPGEDRLILDRPTKLRNLTTDKTVVVVLDEGAALELENVNLPGGLVVYADGDASLRGDPRNKIKLKGTNLIGGSSSGVSPTVGILGPAARVESDGETNTTINGLILLHSAAKVADVSFFGQMILVNDAERLERMNMGFDPTLSRNLPPGVEYADGSQKVRLISVREDYVSEGL